MPAGVRFGEFLLTRRLAAGGMAEVFLARYDGPNGFQKQLVVKRLLPHLASSRAYVELFLKEAKHAALIDHPNLAHVHRFGEVGGRYYLAMEFVDGVTVADLLRKVGFLDPALACQIALDVLDALHAIHTARDLTGTWLQLVHRDVTPRNVMLARWGAAKLLDFGIAVRATSTNVAAGTAKHMSPEQARGAALDARSDLYCFGLLLAELLAGARASWPSRSGSIPPALWEIVESLIAEDPAERPRSAMAVKASLLSVASALQMDGVRSELVDLVEDCAPRATLLLRPREACELEAPERTRTPRPAPEAFFAEDDTPYEVSTVAGPVRSKRGGLFALMLLLVVLASVTAWLTSEMLVARLNGH